MKRDTHLNVVSGECLVLCVIMVKPAWGNGNDRRLIIQRGHGHTRIGS